jgi:hypothetical protein
MGILSQDSVVREGLTERTTSRVVLRAIMMKYYQQLKFTHHLSMPGNYYDSYIILLYDFIAIL